jgi:hypothetical protein
MKTAIWCYFPLSAGTSPHGRYQPHGQWRHLEVDATDRDRAYGWLSWLVMVLAGRGRVGLVTPTPNGHLPALFGGPFHVTTGGMNSGFSLRGRMRLEVLVPQHQTTVYEVRINRGFVLCSSIHIHRARDQLSYINPLSICPVVHGGLSV